MRADAALRLAIPRLRAILMQGRIEHLRPGRAVEAGP